MAGIPGRTGGRNAKTPQEHKLQGTFQKVRHGGYQGPEPPKGRPVSPNPLEGQAKAEWDRMIARLDAQKTISSVDDAVLYQYCKLFAETEAVAEQQEESKASVAILETNLADVDKQDLVQVFGQIVILRKLISKCTDQLRSGRLALRTYLVEFGLTPASRGRVKVPEQTPADPFAEFDGETVQ
jgi:P27 family predicted phage terminase small subunit